MSGELPPHWRTAQAADGKEYYFNEMTGETSWTKPDEVNAEQGRSSPATVSVPIDETPRSRDIGDINVSPATMGGGGDGRGSSGGGPAQATGPLAALAPHTPKLMIIMVASFVVMLQASIEYSHRDPLADSGIGAYAVSVGTVSLILVLLLFLLAKQKPEKIGGETVRKLTLLQLAAGFFFVWWGVGCGILTFHAPYQSTSNAYFACWIGETRSKKK